MTEQRQVQQRAIPRLKNLDPTPSHSFCPVNRAQSNIAAAASAAHCSSSSPVTSGGVAPCCAQLQVSRNSHSASHAWSFPGPRVNSQTRGQVHQVDREGGDDCHEVKHKRTELSRPCSKKYFVLLSSSGKKSPEHQQRETGIWGISATYYNTEMLHMIK